MIAERVSRARRRDRFGPRVDLARRYVGPTTGRSPTRDSRPHRAAEARSSLPRSDAPARAGVGEGRSRAGPESSIFSTTAPSSTSGETSSCLAILGPQAMVGKAMDSDRSRAQGDPASGFARGRTRSKAARGDPAENIHRQRVLGPGRAMGARLIRGARSSAPNGGRVRALEIVGSKPIRALRDGGDAKRVLAGSLHEMAAPWTGSSCPRVTAGAGSGTRTSCGDGGARPRSHARADHSTVLASAALLAGGVRRRSGRPALDRQGEDAGRARLSGSAQPGSIRITSRRAPRSATMDGSSTARSAWFSRAGARFVDHSARTSGEIAGFRGHHALPGRHESERSERLAPNARRCAPRGDRSADGVRVDASASIVR